MGDKANNDNAAAYNNASMRTMNNDADNAAMKQTTGDNAGQNSFSSPHPSYADNDGTGNNNADDDAAYNNAADNDADNNAAGDDAAANVDAAMQTTR